MTAGQATDVVGARTDRQADTDSYLGMIIFIGAWVMMFAALFFAYGVVRLQAPSWPPPAEAPLPRGLPGLNTLVLLASSLSLRAAMSSLRAGRDRAALRRLGGTLALGALFLCGQIAIWRAMSARGLTPASGIYGSVFFALTGFHALHVLCGLVALALLAAGIARAPARRPAARARAVRVTALFWDFIAIVWVAMFVAVYLV